MKKLIIIFLLSGTLCSCVKKSVETPVFDVSTSSLTYKAGDVVKFNFTGKPDILSFYSGEPGFRYKYINRVNVSGKPNLQFTSFAQTVGAQTNTLKILASVDFSGAYDSLNIRKATWINLTSRVILSTGTDNTASGLIDISDINTDGKPVYFAFTKHDDNDPVKKPWSWIIRTFNINLVAADDGLSYPITTIATAGWKPVDLLNPTYKWVVTTSSLTAAGGAVNTPENEEWVITKPLNIYTVKPDVGVSIKTIDANVDSYSYTFKTPGTYTVTFVAQNVNASDQKKVIKELTIVVQ
jgi:plastocyanin